MWETILLAFSPLLVSFLTGGIKQIPGVANSGYKNTIVRFIVAALSYGSVIANSAITGDTIDLASTQIFVETFLIFLAATGTYFFGKKALS